MKKIFSNKKILYGLGIILFFLIWFIISLIINEPIMIFPDPIKTIKEAFRILGTSYFYKCLGTTLMRMLISFAISFLLALIVGILAGTYTNLQHVFKPGIAAIKAIPTAALTFAFIAMLGFKWSPIGIVTLMIFPVLYEAVIAGFNNVPKDVLEALSLEAKTKFTGTFSVKLPLSKSYIVVGILSSFAMSFKIEIMAEIIAGDSSYGIGSAIKASRVSDPSNMIPVFAYAFLAIILILISQILVNHIKAKVKKLKK